jgi:hypothetical protein
MPPPYPYFVYEEYIFVNRYYLLSYVFFVQTLIWYYVSMLKEWQNLLSKHTRERERMHVRFLLISVYSR